MLGVTEVESRLVEFAQAGELLDVSAAPEPDIRAAVIRDLLCGSGADALDPRGVRLRGARILGRLNLTDVRAPAPLVLQDCAFEERAVFNRAHLPHLDLSGSALPALEAGDLVCEHDVQLRSIRCEQLHLIGARVTGQLSLDGADLQAGEDPALNAERMTVGNGLFLTKNFRASSANVRGTLCFLGASITGPFELDSAKLDATHGPALNADWMSVTGSVFLNQGFTASSNCHRGTLRMHGATITGQLNLNEASVWNSTDQGPGIVVIDARVGSDLVIPLQVLDAGRSCSILANVNGLRYPSVPRGATYREWLALLANHTPAYAAQPYQQLAAVYRAAGHDQEARQILIAQQKDLRRRGDLGGHSRQLLHSASGVFIGYGHRPFRALGFLAVVWIIAMIVVFGANLAGLIVRPGSGGGACSLSESFGIAVDTAVPVLKNSSGKECEIATSASWGQVTYIARYFLQVLGWAFATLFVAGYTGLVRKDT